MAGKQRGYAKYGPEVFEVGREQAIGLLHESWDARIFRYRCEYLVVCALSWFGDGAEMQEWDGCDSLEDAVASVEHAYKNDLRLSEDDILSCGSDYEIWHLVDDGELWDEWERRVHVFAELERCGHAYVGYMEGVSLDSLSELLDVYRCVKRHLQIITQIERLFVNVHGFDFVFHGMNWRNVNKSGEIFDLMYRYGSTITVHRFASKREYCAWSRDNEELFHECNSFDFRFLYDSRGIYAYEDLESMNGEQSIGDLDSLACYFGFGPSPYVEGVDERPVF